MGARRIIQTAIRKAMVCKNRRRHLEQTLDRDRVIKLGSSGNKLSMGARKDETRNNRKNGPMISIQQ